MKVEVKITRKPGVLSSESVILTVEGDRNLVQKIQRMLYEDLEKTGEYSQE